jgi:dynein heavy chain
VLNFGEKMGFVEANKKYFQISLGAEMEEQAIAKLNQSFKEGLWLMLQNIHLMPKFLTDLEKQLEKIAQSIGAGNPNFRLFLSAKPSN